MGGGSRDLKVCVSSAGMGSQSATVSPLAKYKLVFLGDQSVGKFDFIIPFEHRNVDDVKCRRFFNIACVSR